MGEQQLSQTTVSQQRTKNYFKQLKGSFVFKVLTILASFLLIPIMIGYLGNEQYGIWSTLLSIVSWVVLFDMGIGNGLRNKISESIAKGNLAETQRYIATSYVLIGGIAFVLLFLFLFISGILPWQKIFNTNLLSDSELQTIVNITFVFIFLNFWLSLINQVANGLQKSSITAFNQFFSNFIALVLIYLLSRFTESSLTALAALYGVALIISNILISVWFYNNHRHLFPRTTLYTKEFAKSVSMVGLQFFIIQIAVIIIFTTDKILITQLFGPEFVTEYDVVFKLFSIVTVGYSILVTPLWSAYSDAFHRGDLPWIRKTVKNQLKIFGLLVAGTLMLVFLAPFIIDIWIGKDFPTDLLLTLIIALFTLVSVWNNIFAYLVNGIGEIKIQLYTSLVALIINIPISILIVKQFHTGVYGIVIGTIISLSLFAVAGPIQTYYLLKEKDANGAN